MAKIDRSRVKEAAEIIGVRPRQLTDELHRRGFLIADTAIPCRYSPDGIAMLAPKNPDAHGVCTGGWRGSDTIMSVVWDNKSAPEDIHRDFIILEPKFISG